MPDSSTIKKDKAAVIADGRFGRGAQTRLNAPRLLFVASRLRGRAHCAVIVTQPRILLR
jgi:hypothetical protein